MPKRFIEIPGPITLRDPRTKEVLKKADGGDEVWDFGEFLNKLMHNPKWAENYANMRSQAAIEEAYEEGKASGIMELAEEDWKKLQEAAENPRTQFVGHLGPQVVPGYGLHPTMSRQIIPLVQAIVEAKTERPKLKDVSTQASA